ncbi:MAG: ChaN family lipoprotein [Proteobacteria bacterium]|nr:ChaN family lipoprotein [Pseudomonadota bacterium]
MRRRQVLGSGGLLLAGCAATPAAAEDRIVDTASGREIGRGELVARLRAADLVLLGEQHDNVHHHRRRAALITELSAAPGAATVIVAEHLPRGQRVGPGAEPLSRLQAAGFDPKGWGWPQHEGLFAPLLAAGIPVLGGNAPLDVVRAVARQGDAALPPDLAAAIAAAPLPPAAQAALDHELLDSHCGQLPAARVPAMRAAQRLRDASMAAALLAAADAGAKPALLVAGNGHVRSDLGVPVLLRAQRPALRIVSVCFVESDASTMPCDYRWITPGPPTPRQDPCAGFKMPARG